MRRASYCLRSIAPRRSATARGAWQWLFPAKCRDEGFSARDCRGRSALERELLDELRRRGRRVFAAAYSDALAADLERSTGLDFGDDDG